MWKLVRSEASYNTRLISFSLIFIPIGTLVFLWKNYTHTEVIWPQGGDTLAMNWLVLYLFFLICAMPCLFLSTRFWQEETQERRLALWTLLPVAKHQLVWGRLALQVKGWLIGMLSVVFFSFVFPLKLSTGALVSLWISVGGTILCLVFLSRLLLERFHSKDDITIHLFCLFLSAAIPS